MSILFCQKNGFPFLVDSDNLPKIEEDKALERLMQIAIALDRDGYEGLRVQEYRCPDGRFIQSLECKAGALGQRIFEHILDFSRKRKSIPTVEFALRFARTAKEIEAQNETA